MYTNAHTHTHSYTETLTAYYTGQSKKSIDVFGITIWNYFLLRSFFFSMIPVKGSRVFKNIILHILKYQL